MPAAAAQHTRTGVPAVSAVPSTATPCAVDVAGEYAEAATADADMLSQLMLRTPGLLLQATQQHLIYVKAYTTGGTLWSY